MALYNPMEDKQLNFYQPLLSVRRGSSSSSSTSSFAESEKKRPSNPPPSIPPLPYYKSELKSGPVTNPGVVPFNWERIPGKPKNDTKLQNKVADQPPPPPKYPPGRVLRLEDDKEENDSSRSEGESYFDAVDMLSCSESSFLNCSLSGVSGFHDADSSGIFSDRDFMMGRFLPAAKAVTFETPQLGSIKQTRSMKDELPKKNSQYCYAPTSLSEHQEDGDEGEEDEDYNYPETETKAASSKLCGSLIPWFCMLNVLPGMRDEPHAELPKKYSDPDRGIYKYNKSEKLSTAIRDAVYERRRLTVYQKSETRLEFGHLNDELKKNIDHSSQIKEDGDTNSSSSESITTTSFHEVLNQEVQKENGIILSDFHANDNETIVEINPILPPPLPKSPTESWLSRALPSMSNKHPHSKTYLGTKNLGLKPSPAKPKWEDVVKCSDLHSKNFGLALTSISEN